MQLRLAVLLALAACGSPRAKPAAAAEAAAPAGDPNPGCSCERLNAPVEVPGQADELARWERVATQLATLETAIGDLFPRSIPCTASAREQIEQLVAAHAAALSENSVLNDETCDHFSRWRFVRWPDRGASMRLVEAMRAGCVGLDGPSLEPLNQLLITRGCTTTSLLTDEENGGRDQRPDERAQRDHVGERDPGAITHQRATTCAASAATATDDSETSVAMATNAANSRSRARLLR